MAAPKPSNKSARMTRGRTAAIQASRDRTKAQTAPGTEYKATRAAKKAAGGGGGSGGKKKDPVAEGKARIAKMRETTARLRSKRQAMASKLNPFRRK